MTALVVGTTLMRDIGDAWQSMAEQGDVQGIVITFLLAVSQTLLQIEQTLSVNTEYLLTQQRGTPNS